MMSCVQVRALLHAHYSPRPLSVDEPSQAATDAVAWLRRNELVDGDCALTAKGAFLVKHILDTPLPRAVQAFVITRETSDA